MYETIDDAETYFLNFESDGSPTEAGGTHIGMFLGWALLRGLAAPSLQAHLPALRSGAKTGRSLLFEHCDGKLQTADLSERANAFAAAYYGASYLNDYLRMFGLKDDPFDELAKVQDDRLAQESVCQRLDRRYSEWRMAQGLPSKETLCDALQRVAGPVLEAAGFVPFEDTGFAADAAERGYINRAAWQTPRVVIYGAARADQCYGLGVRVGLNVPELYARASAEKQLDRWPWANVDPSTLAMPLAALAKGWTGPIASNAYHPVLWIFETEEIAPAADFLAARLREFVLPNLARMTSLSALCAVLNTRPISASPWFRAWDSHTLPLAFELANHPALPEVLDQMEAHWRSQPRDPQRAMMEAFLQRMRGRLPPKTKAPTGLLGRLLGRGRKDRK